MPSFSIPLSGLAASSEALNIISNNLANLNTVGFKDQTRICSTKTTAATAPAIQSKWVQDRR
jgi:flagellar hook protein FlgE